MCKDHEHRFDVEVNLSKGGSRQTKHVIVNAIGMTKAVAKADYWAIENFPDADWVEIRTYHNAYGSIQSALDHGAIPPNENTLAPEPNLKRMSVSELQGLIQKASEELGARASVCSCSHGEVTRNVFERTRDIFYFDGGVIAAIKYLKASTGWDLRRTKETFDFWRSINWRYM